MQLDSRRQVTNKIGNGARELQVNEHEQNWGSLKLSPHNFSELLRLCEIAVEDSAANLQVRRQFEPVGDMFFCELNDITLQFEKVWIIDADDTLWEDNIYYEEIIAELIDYLIHNGIPLSVEELRHEVDKVEHEIIPLHGFGAKGFAISMREAWSRMCTRFSNAMPEPSDFFNGIIPQLSEVPKIIPEQTSEFLQALQARSAQGLILFTQGPIDIQLAKIARSGLAPLFHAIAVGKNKSTETYKDLIKRFSHPTKEFIVVGNSLNSEIKPALDLGLRAFHYRNPNSWKAVNTSTLDTTRYIGVDSLLDILKHLS